MPWIVSVAPGNTIGAGLEYGFGTEGIPTGARGVGKQRDWLSNSPYGPDTRGFLKTFGFDIDDVGEDPVYEVPNESGGKDYLVPFGKWKYRGGASWVRWTRLRYREDVAAKQAATTAETKDKLRAAQDLLVQLEAEEQAAQIAAQVRDKQAKIAAINASGTTTTGTTGTPGTTSPAGLRTYEVYGRLNGNKVPLSQVLVNQGGQFVLIAGGSRVVGDSPTDGFGLAGIPGRWSAFYASQSPSQFGLDADKAVLAWDGARGWVVPAATLAQMFGADWRGKIY